MFLFSIFAVSVLASASTVESDDVVAPSRNVVARLGQVFDAINHMLTPPTQRPQVRVRHSLHVDSNPSDAHQHDNHMTANRKKRQEIDPPRPNASARLSAALLKQAREANANFIDAPEHLGCFADRESASSSSSDFEFSVNFTDLSQATVPGCARICRDSGFGLYPFFAVRGALCLCGREFGAFGPLSYAYCRGRCFGDPYVADCDPTPDELALARNTTPAEADLVFERRFPSLNCGGGYRGASLPPPPNGTLCTLMTPRPTPSPSPTPALNPNVQYGVDFSDFGYGSYSGPRNSVYRVNQLPACNLGRATVTALQRNTCGTPRKCILDRLVCNGTVVDDVGGYSKPLEICVVRSVACREDTDDTFPALYDFFKEQGQRDCFVHELMCDGVRATPDKYFGDRSHCDVRVRCDRGRVEYGYDAFGWRCTNQTLVCDTATPPKCTVEQVGCNGIDPPRFIVPNATNGTTTTTTTTATTTSSSTTTTSTTAVTPAPTSPPTCVQYTQACPTCAFIAMPVACGPGCVASVNATTCRCPSDFYGDRCQYERAFQCDVALREPRPSCRQPTNIADELLSADRACFNVAENSSVAFSYQMRCEFADTPTQQLPAFVRNLLLAGADLGIPAAQDALDGIMDNRTAALERLLEQFNETVYRIGADPRTSIDNNFTYFVVKPGAFALSEPPYWHVTEKYFDMMQIMDDSLALGVSLSLAAMRGDEVFAVNRSLADIPQRFRTAGRLYAELRWTPDWGVPPNGTQSKRVLRRHFVDIVAQRPDVGASGDTGVSSTVVGAVIAVAAILIIVLVIVLLLLRRRRSYQRR